jgi:hypothetical protein
MISKADKADKLERAFLYTGGRILRARTARHRLLWIGRRNRLAWLLIYRQTMRLRSDAHVITNGT